MTFTAPTKEEIQNALKQLRNGKAAGPDDIPAEALKIDIRTNVEMLYPFYTKICEEEQILSNRGRVTSSSSPKKVISAPAPVTEV